MTPSVRACARYRTCWWVDRTRVFRRARHCLSGAVAWLPATLEFASVTSVNHGVTGSPFLPYFTVTGISQHSGTLRQHQLLKSWGRNKAFVGLQIAMTYMRSICSVATRHRVPCLLIWAHRLGCTVLYKFVFSCTWPGVCYGARDKDHPIYLIKWLKRNIFLFFWKCAHSTFDLDLWPCPPLGTLKSGIFIEANDCPTKICQPNIPPLISIKWPLALAWTIRVSGLA